MGLNPDFFVFLEPFCYTFLKKNNLEKFQWLAKYPQQNSNILSEIDIYSSFICNYVKDLLYQMS